MFEMVAKEVSEAIENDDLEAVKQLSSKVLNPSLIDEHGCNSLHLAARHSGPDLIAFLVNQRGFKATERSNIGATPCHDAAAAGNLEALKWLVRNTTCNVNNQDGTGATALHLACRFHHTQVTEWLLDEAKADSSKVTSSDGLPLHFAVVGGDYDAVKLLLEDDPSSANLQISNGATASYLAAQEGHIEILRLLISEYRGNVKIKAYDGMSVVHAAAQSGHLDCVRFLVDEEKCNPNDRDFDGATPLHYAASQGHDLVIDWLMKVGGAKVTLDNLGGSPLHNAAECNQIECVKVLIRNGCSIEITDNNGLTAAELAKKCFHEKCANIIATYKPQSQLPIDDDIAYLNSVQSPRSAFPHPLTSAHAANPANRSSLLGYITPSKTGYTAPSRPGYTPPYRSQDDNFRQNVGNGNTHKIQADVILKGTKQQPLTPEVVVNGIQSRSPARARSPEAGYSINRSKGEYSKGASRPKSPDLTFIRKQTLHSDDSFIPRLDLGHSGVHSDVTGPSNEPRRRFSLSNSESDASHSSLSQLDDVIAFAEKTVAKETKKNYELVKEKMDRANFGIEGESEQFKPKVQNLRTVKVDSVSQQAKKGVTFSEATEHINDTDDALYDDAFSKPPETHILGQQKVNVKNQTKAFENGGIKGGQHGTGTNMEKITGHFSRTALAEDGSVIISIDSPGTQPYVALIGNQSAVLSDNFGNQSQPSYVNSIGRAELLPAPHPHSSGSHPSFKHGYLTTIITVDEHRHDGNSQNTLGEASYYVPPAPPLSTIPTRRNVTDTTQATRPTALQMRPESNHFLLTSKSGSNISNDRTKFNDVDNPSRHMDSSYKHPDLDNDVYENTINQSKPQLLVALPPPPPPLPPSLVNRNHSMSNITQNASAAETKGNPAYLPARPAALLTPEMMQAQYGALSPTNTRMAIDNSANSDFISELKEATKGGALKKMSKNTRLEDKLSPTPITVFSSGQKIDIVNGGVSHETEPKMELKGEWDPKNFIDQVPNRGDLPAWKVQLAAKQIAEKAMKETLEKRKVEEREARFKDMPAWKRAIVERKEAEARSAEEKRQAEEQQRAQHSSNKRVPHVQVMPKSGDKSLAPWQLELQHK